MNSITRFVLFFLLVSSFLSFGQNVTSDPDAVAAKSDSLFSIHLKRNKLDSALFHARKSLQIRRKMGDKPRVVQSLMNLGEVYEKQKKKKDALDVFKLSATTAKTVRDPEIKKKAYDRVIVALKKADNYKEAYYYQTVITQLNDSVAAALLKQKLEEQSRLHENFQASKSENRNQILQQEKEIQKLTKAADQIRLDYENYRQITLYIFVAVGVLVLTLLIARIAVKRKLVKERKANRAIESERVSIAKDIRNEFDTELSRISDLSQELFYKPSGPDFKKQLNSITEISTKLLLDVRDLVWSVNGTQATLQELIKQINVYSEEYFKEFSVEVVSRSPEAIQDFQIPKPVFRTIFVVMKEIFFQLAKQSKPMNVYLTFSMVDNRLNITVHDDGIGLQYDPDNREDWYQRVRNRLQTAGGLLSVTKEELGNRFRLDIQLSQLIKK
jgi:signal transduction histidine kinase